MEIHTKYHRYLCISVFFTTFAAIYVNYRILNESISQKILQFIGILLNKWDKTWLACHLIRSFKFVHNQRNAQKFQHANSVDFPKNMLTLGENHISIGRGTRFGEYLYLTAWERTCAGGNFTLEIHIGENCCFGAWNRITSTNRIEIGNNLLTGKWVTITDNSHGEGNYIEPDLKYGHSYLEALLEALSEE